MGEAWNSSWVSIGFTKLLNGLHIAIGVMKLESHDYPLLQDSKGDIDWHMHTYTAKDLFSAYSHDIKEHSWKIKRFWCLYGATIISMLCMI
jgi:hypothetical protein